MLQERPLQRAIADCGVQRSDNPLTLATNRRGINPLRLASDLRDKDTAMSKMIFPAIVVPNDCYIGDNVLIEPIASALAYSGRTYVVSEWPEMFQGHPQIIGVKSTSEIPENVLWRSLNLHNAIASTKQGENGEMAVLPGKMQGMYKAAGISLGRARAPRLFLTPKEKTEALERKRFFKRPLVGVVARSRHEVKDWRSTEKFVKKGVKEGWSVFLIDETENGVSPLESGKVTYRIAGRDIRELMIALSMMDVVVGPDTGPVHIAAALGVPVVVISYRVFKDLYEHYPEAREILVPNIPQRKGIKTVPASRVFREVSAVVAKSLTPKTTYEPCGGKHCFVRFRGLGDVLLSLIPLAGIKSLDGKGEYTYVTSPAAAKLVKISGLADKVIAMEYQHSTSGFPPLPDGFDFTQFDTVANLINKVDFLEASKTMTRAHLFAKEMGLSCVQEKNRSWGLKVPSSWLNQAKSILKKHGVEEGGKFIALQSDSNGQSRIWPIERQREFCGYANRRGFRVVVLSDVETKGYPPCAVNLTGKTNIEEYVGIIKLCSCFLGSDSSGIHIAGFLRIPAVGIFGSVDPGLRISMYDTVFPLTGKSKCIPCNDWQDNCCRDKKRFPVCMWEISARRAFSEVKRTIKRCRDKKEITQEQIWS